MVDSSKLSVQVSRIYHTQTTHIHENKQQTADYQKKKLLHDTMDAEDESTTSVSSVLRYDLRNT
jgi:hypothetical protein